MFAAFLLLQNSMIFTQEICKGFFAHQEGMTWTTTSYNKNKKKTGSIAYEVLFNDVEDGVNTIIFGYKGMDEDGEEMYSGEFTGTCADNVFTTSHSGTFADIIEQTANMEVEITGDLVQYPFNLNAGDKLQDASVTLVSRVENGLSLLKVTSDVFNRKVIGREKVVTPAGTFDCIKISYDAKVKMLISKSMSIVEYLSEGVGIVRSEQYDKKGNLSGYTEITSLKKP